MINYIEKGYGLHQAIRAAGHWLREEDGVWVSSNDDAVQVIIDGYTDAEALAHAQQAKCAESEAIAKKMRDKVVAAFSAGEMASWTIKASEAATYAATGSADNCPMLSMESNVRGITVAELVGKINGNALKFMQVECMIAGVDGKHRDAINALTTTAEVDVYDISTGWPGV